MRNIAIPPPPTGETARGALAIAAAGISGSARPLPFRGEMERAFGISFVGVRAHLDGAAARASDRLRANGYTLGNDVAFDRPDPSRELVGHELAHVVQQRAGAGPASGIGRKGDSYEREADAAAAALGRGAPVALARSYPAAGLSRAVQRSALQLDLRDPAAAPARKVPPDVAAVVLRAIIDVIDANVDAHHPAGDRSDIGVQQPNDYFQVPSDYRPLLALWRGVVGRRRITLLQNDKDLASLLPRFRVADVLAATQPVLDALAGGDPQAHPQGRALLDAFDVRLAQERKAEEKEDDDYLKDQAKRPDLKSAKETPTPTLEGRPAEKLPSGETQNALRKSITEGAKAGITQGITKGKEKEESEKNEAKLKEYADKNADKYQGSSGLVRLGKGALDALGLNGDKGIILAFDNKQFRPLKRPPASKASDDAYKGYAGSHLNQLAPRFRLRYRKAGESFQDVSIPFSTDARYFAPGGELQPIPHDIEAIQTFSDASELLEKPENEGLSPDGKVEAIVTQSSGYRFHVQFEKGGPNGVIAQHKHPDTQLAKFYAIVSSTDIPNLPNANLTKDFGVVGRQVTGEPTIDPYKGSEPLFNTEYEANAIAGGRVDASSDGARRFIFADLYGSRGTRDDQSQKGLFDALIKRYKLGGSKEGTAQEQKVYALADEPLVSSLYVRRLTLNTQPDSESRFTADPAQGPYYVKTPGLLRPILEHAMSRLVAFCGGTKEEREFAHRFTERLVDTQRPFSDASIVASPIPAPGNRVKGYTGQVFAASSVDTEATKVMGLSGPPNSAISKIGDIKELSLDALVFEERPVPEVRARGVGLKLEAISGYRVGDRLRFEVASDDEDAGSSGGNVDGGVAEPKDKRVERKDK